MLSARILTAVAALVVVLAALFLLPPVGWGLLTLIVVVAAAHEWAMLAGFERRRWLLFLAGAFLLCFNLLFNAGLTARGWPDGIIVAVCGVATAFWLLVAPPWLARHWRFASSPLVAAVVGWVVLVSTWVAVVQLHARSPWLVLAAMALVWIADTAAYFSGRAFGQRKLAPAISPGKTWEGVYGALAAVAAYALVLALATDGFGYSGPRSPRAAVLAVAIAMALSAVSMIGDLFESLLKRQRGVKDSGSLLPGHGGVLDRIDALTAAMPPAALLATLLLR
jgi:phosphatidate cytidylyltransferase